MVAVVNNPGNPALDDGGPTGFAQGRGKEKVQAAQDNLCPIDTEVLNAATAPLSPTFPPGIC